MAAFHNSTKNLTDLIVDNVMLELGSRGVTDANLKALVGSPDSRNLIELDLSDDDITDDGVAASASNCTDSRFLLPDGSFGATKYLEKSY